MQQKHSGFYSFLVLTSLMAFTNALGAKDNPLPSQKALSLQEPLNEEEAFLVRRIAEFWKDGDYALVKSQIKDFLKKYPHSPSGDILRGILGDLYLQEKKYENALGIYEAISDISVKEKIMLNKLQCHYELNQFSSLTSAALPYVTSQPECFKERMDEFHFLIAEGFFHQAFETTDYQLKEHLLELAEPHYEKLTQSPYADTSLFAIAEINRLLGRPKKASEIYQELALRYPADEEELLFQMASMQALFDKELAIESFEKIIKGNGKKTQDARFNQMVLYFQIEQYQNVLDLHEDLIANVSSDQKTLFHYIVGKSYFALNQYEPAIRYIKNYFEFQPEEGPILKNAYLILMTSAAQTNQEALFDQTISQFEKQFPFDEELPKALFMHALLCKEMGNTEKLGERLELLLKKYPFFENRESLLFEYGIFCHDQKRWKDCYDMFNVYLSEFPLSPRHVQARKFLVSSSLYLFKMSDQESPTGYSLATLSQDLEKALLGEDQFSNKEKAQYRLLYAKSLFSIGNYKKALEMLSNLDIFSSDSNYLSEVYYLRAESYHEMLSEPHFFYESMEKALELNPELGENPSIRLQLYNSYITESKALSNKKPLDEKMVKYKDQLLEKAASHLFVVFNQNLDQIKLENRLWLANHYFNKAKTLEQFDPTGENFLTAITLYEKILYSTSGQLSKIAPETLYLEQEAIKYAELLGYQNNWKEKIHVLKHLVQTQNAQPDWEWRLKNEALLELAQSYEIEGDLESSLETYAFLQSAQNLAFSTVAKFHASKLRFMLLDPDQKNENNDAIKTILSELKDLQIRKNPLSEPLHLEAGLEYAMIRSQVSEKTKQNDRYFFFLNRLKEDFESSNDPVAIDYKEKLYVHPDKKAMYEIYMKYIDAELLRTQANIKRSEKGFMEAEELSSRALAIYSELQNSNIPYSYLKKRIKQSMQELQAFDGYR